MHFFFYGTLLPGSANVASIALEAVLRPLGPAVARGRLYAIPDTQGWYPALLPGQGEVSGQLCVATPEFKRQDLAAIDAYEDCDPGAVTSSLYRRVLVHVRGESDSSRRAMAYVFNRKLPAGSRRIADGDFRAWLARTGSRAFCGRSRPDHAV